MIETYFIIGIGIICLLSLIYLYKYLIIRDSSNSSNSSNSNIPKVMYKTGPISYNNLPIEIIQLFDETKKNNPGLKIKYYDDDMCKNFIKNNFDSDVLYAFNTLKPGAYKADLFRYCILYINGGIYGDLSQKYLVPLTDLIDFENDKLVLIEDINWQNLNYKPIQISFMAAIPKLKIYNMAIYGIVENCKNKYYGLDPLFPTGPYHFGKYLKYADKYRMEYKELGGFLGNNKKIIQTRAFGDYKHRSMIDKNNANKFNYVPLWKNRDIYNI